MTYKDRWGNIDISVWNLMYEAAEEELIYMNFEDELEEEYA